MIPKERKQEMSDFNMGQYDENHFYRLCEPQIETCEFCEDGFQNRYRCLIHTAKHIIIPLIKHDIFQCQYCLFSFTSNEDVIFHKKIKHTVDYLAEIMQQVVTKNVAIKCEKIDLDLSETCEEDVVSCKRESNKSIIKKEPSMSVAQIKTTKNNDEITKNMKNLTLEFLKANAGLSIKKLTVCDPPDEVKAKALKKPQMNLSQLLTAPQKPMTKRQITMSPVVNPINKIVTNLTNISVKPTSTIITQPMMLNEFEISDDEFILPDISPVKREPIEIEEQNKVVIQNIINHAISKKFTPHLDKSIQMTEDVGATSVFDSKSILKKYCNPNTQTMTNIPTTNIATSKTMVSNCTITIVNGQIQRPESNYLATVNNINNHEAKVLTENKTIHYDELIKPGMFRCRRCGLTFPNKFDVITHETAAHFGFKRKTQFGAMHCTICDWYIAGNYHSLNNHIESKHSNAKASRRTEHCNKCKLRYNNQQRHDQIYHKIPINTTKLPELRAKFSQVNKCLLCDVCSMFLKNNRYCKYVRDGVLQEYGKKYTCTRCNSVVDAVEILRIFKYKYVPKHSDEKKDTKVTNEERLHKIQRRLIRLKKI